MITYRISIVDDEESIRDSLEMFLAADYEVLGYGDAESFLSKLEECLPDLVLMDIGLPEMNGIEALRQIKENHPDLPVIMVTAFEEIRMVIESMRLGAFDFVLKPLNPDLLLLTIEKALESIALRKEVKRLQEKYLTENHPCFIGESREIEDIMDFINMVAQSPDTPILISGETGTGKELIARAIHARSPVFQGPFVPVNCSAFPEDLIESELFGYAAGAFSGASPSGKKGLIEAASGGTLFLDEVADLSASGQAKLLRFLESGEFYKVGSTRKRKISTRIVSATNKDLGALVAAENFRKDLYFRLCVVKADIPSLNQRKEDILPLAKHFLLQFNTKFSKNLEGFTPGAQKALMEHPFTGNVRELKNLIERASLVTGSGRVARAALGLQPPENRKAAAPSIRQEFLQLTEAGMDLKAELKKLEYQMMQQALSLCGGNESAAARLLKMNHHTFRYRLKKFESF